MPVGEGQVFISNPSGVAMGDASTPVRTDPTGTTPQPISGPADLATAGTLGALNATATCAMTGHASVGFQLAAGTLIGTIIPEWSFDGGTTWVQGVFDDPTTSTKVTSIVFASSNGAIARSIIGAGGASNVRVRVSAYTSGTAGITLNAAQVNDPSVLFSGQMAVAVPPDIAQVGASDGTLLQSLSARYDQRLRTGRDQTLFLEAFTDAALPAAATSPNGNLNWRTAWTTPTNPFGVSKPFELNSTAATSGGVQLDTWRRWFQPNSYPFILECRVRVTVLASGGIAYFGMLNPDSANPSIAPGTTTPGPYFQVDSATGNVTGVIAAGTGLTSTAVLTTIASANYYTYRMTVFQDAVLFQVSSNDGTILTATRLNPAAASRGPLAQSNAVKGAGIMFKYIPGAGAGDMFIDSVMLSQGDADLRIPYADLQAVGNKGANIDLLHATQAAAWDNSLQPASATLSNTAAGYTTLGGRFQFAAVAGAETDYALFAYFTGGGVSAGRTLVITGVSVDAACFGAAGGALATVLEWALGTNSNAISLVTGTPTPVIRTPLGQQVLPALAPMGTSFSPRLAEKFPAPLAATTYYSPTGGYVHVILRVPQGLATVGQIIRGQVRIEGYWL